MRRYRATPVSDQAYHLGEGPLWDPARGRVLWVDVNAGHVHEGVLADGRVEHRAQLEVEGTAGAVVAATNGALLVAGTQVLHRIEPDGSRSEGPRVLPAGRASRLNDGGCDPSGRFVVGSLAQDGRTGEEVLVRVDDGGLTVLDDDLTLSNGLAWSPDGRLMYSVDTTPGTVWVRPYDGDSDGTGVGPRRELLHVHDASPDGLCVNAEGNLWLAVWGAGEVRCYSPDGRQLAVVEVAAPHTSSVAFVGPRLDLLLVTTARAELSADQLDRWPDSGRLHLVDVGVTGLATTPWDGR